MVDTASVVRQRIVSDPAQARQLGALFAANRTTTMSPFKSIGTFDVDGKENGVLYGKLDSGDTAANMAGGIEMRPGSTYRINAEGTIDKNGTGIFDWGGDVGPEDKQQGRDGTRLQVAITKDGDVLETMDYKPGMEISTDVEGAKLGFVFADGGLHNNSGSFDVTVEASNPQTIQNEVAIVAADADGIERAGQAIMEGLDSGPKAASIPEPDKDLATAPEERGIIAKDDSLETADGYRFKFDENQVTIDWPGRHNDGSAETVIEGRQVTEGDGTEWKADDGNYYLPNGAVFNLEYDGDKIKNFTLVHGDSKAEVTGLNTDDPDVGRVTGGGNAYRHDILEDNIDIPSYRMGGLNDGESPYDITWNAELYGRNVGRMEDGDRIDPGAGYVVDPGLRPEFGTQAYERALHNEIQNMYGNISGLAQEHYGVNEDTARQMANWMLNQSGAYDAYAQQMQMSQLSREDPAKMEQLAMQQLFQQMFGGLPQQHGNYNDAMGSIQQLQQLMMMMAGMQSSLQQATNSQRSHIPSVEAARNGQIDPATLIDQVLTGVGQRRNRLERFDIGDRVRRSTDSASSRIIRDRTSRSSDSTTRTRVDRDKVAKHVGDISGRIASGDVDGTDLNKLRAMGRSERLAVLEKLGSSNIKKMVEDGAGSEDETQRFIAELVRDAKTEPSRVKKLMPDVLDGLSEDWDSDDLLRGVQKELGGGEMAAEALAPLGNEVLDKMYAIHKDGNDDITEMGVISQAKALNNTRGSKSTKETVGKFMGDWSYKLNEGVVGYPQAKAMTQELAAMSPEARQETLRQLGTDNLQKISQFMGSFEDDSASLMAAMVKDSKGNSAARSRLNTLLGQINNLGDDDNILQKMQVELGGGAIDQDANAQRAANHLKHLGSGILDQMTAIHYEGVNDTDEIAVVARAKALIQ